MPQHRLQPLYFQWIAKRVDVAALQQLRPAGGGGVGDQQALHPRGQIPRADLHFALAPGRQGRQASTDRMDDAEICTKKSRAASGTPEATCGPEQPFQPREISAAEIIRCRSHWGDGITQSLADGAACDGSNKHAPAAERSCSKYHRNQNQDCHKRRHLVTVLVWRPGRTGHIAPEYQLGVTTVCC
jgi:hypothetical protein